MSTPPQQSARVDKETFLHYVRMSGLIPTDVLALAMTRIPATDRGRVVARGLVERGLLTRFQAERLLAGKTDGFILGQYRILDELGRGGMGRVFKAEHITMSRVVALKILNPNMVKTERARLLFQREVKAAARLSHPNIVTAFDANHVDDRWYLVMEFVDGPNLQDLVKEHGPLPIAQACEYIRQAAVGLQYAHELGMVHRDIKPANLLVQKSPTRSVMHADQVKILDFGLARLSHPEKDGNQGDDSIMVLQQTVMGTPDYLPPEQARSLHLVDGRGDLYSLGCTLWYLLTGQVVFPGGTTMEKLVRHSTEQPRQIQSLRPEIPADLAAIIHKLLEKAPENRFQSAGALAEALMPFAVPQGGPWVTIPSLPPDEPMPVSGFMSDIHPASGATSSTSNNPWAGIDHDEATSNTLPDESARTRVDEPDLIAPRRRRRNPRNTNGGLSIITISVLMLAVVVAVILALRLMILKLV